MSKFTRRTMLAGTAAAAVASPRSIVAPAHAAAPAAGKQAPGFYRYRVGSYEITVVTDGARSFPLPDTFVTNVKKDDVNATLEAAHLPRDMMTLVFNPIVINTGSKLLAIDTGYGAARPSRTPPTASTSRILQLPASTQRRSIPSSSRITTRIM
jgi:hypothetical protein